MAGFSNIAFGWIGYDAGVAGYGFWGVYDFDRMLVRSCSFDCGNVAKDSCKIPVLFAAVLPPEAFVFDVFALLLSNDPPSPLIFLL